MNRLLVITVALFISFTTGMHAQSAPITLDGFFNDWTTDLASIEDAPETISGIDLLEMQASNDENYLYIRIKTSDEFDLLEKLIDQDVRLYLDTDNDFSTGQAVQAGFGAELAIVFSERYATFHPGPVTQVRLPAFSFRVSPTVSASEFEMAIKRDAVPDGSNALFSSSTIKILLVNDLNEDKLPDEESDFLYTFDESPVDPVVPVDLVKGDSSHIRILAYNTKRDGLTMSENLPHFESIVTALEPDIIGFSECYNTSAEYVKGLLDSWLPTGTPEGWYTKSGAWGDLITASRWPLIYEWDNLNRQFPTLINLPDEYAKDLLFTNAHLNCCDRDELRQEQVDTYIDFILDAKTTGGIITLPEGTPFIYAGDLNLVGYAQQLTTLLTGEIQNSFALGEGGPPDWDNSDQSDALLIHSDDRMDYTWRNDYGSYPPGKLDFIIYSDAVLNLEKSFSLETDVMSASRLQQYGLKLNDSRNASDHLPVVADFSLNTTLVIPQQFVHHHKIYPNPASSILNIKFEREDTYLVKISDAKGSIVFSDRMWSNLSTIDIEGFSSGIYFLTIIGSDGSKEDHKIIIR